MTADMKYAVLIPVYQNNLDDLEKFDLENNIRKLWMYDIRLVMPQSLDFFLHIETDNIDIIRFDDYYFKDFNSYSRLMMSDEFYQTFEKYEKILICQLDAYVFNDQMDYFCTLPYDYIGAPAFIRFHEDGKYELLPGNGGFSLRDVRSTLRLLRNHSRERNEWKGTEDMFFVSCAMKYPDEFCMAPVSIAATFAFDRFVSVMYERTHKQLPFGIHAWHKYMPQLVCQTMTLKQRMFMERFLDMRSVEEVMRPFYDFLERNSTVILYGAGDWGKVIGRALQVLKKDIFCYVISDGQARETKEIFGVPIYCWSDIGSLPQRIGVVISLAQRYLEVNEREKIHCNIREKGVDDILDVDFRMFNFIAEIILRSG